jgi:SAM-dependent methyltransferase
MPACCSTFERVAERQFNEKKVAEELARFRRQGPGPTTRLLQDGIAQSGALAGTLLDIGSGVGSLTFGLLDRGMSRAVAVDASAAYISAARQESERLGRARAVQFVHADFVSAASHLPAAAVVTLDRVVCCYPLYEPLLAAALGHAERCLALSYPRDVWYVRVAVMLENAQRRLAHNTFRTVVHPARHIERLIRAAGFELSSRRRTWMWSADVYVRRTTSD